MRRNSFAGQVLAVFSRRTPAFQPRQGEPSSFPGAILYHRLNPVPKLDADVDRDSIRGRSLGSWVASISVASLSIVVAVISVLTRNWRPEWVSITVGALAVTYMQLFTGRLRESRKSGDPSAADRTNHEDKHGDVS
jgi:hypothetical protein